MKKLLVLVCFFLLAGNLICQNIEVKYLTDIVINNADSDGFNFIDKKFDLSDIEKIAEYTLKMPKTGQFSLIPTFSNLQADARKTGANAYYIRSAEYTDNQYKVNIDTYYFTEEMIRQNHDLYTKDKVFIFGDLQTNIINEGTVCTINKGKIEIMPFSYMEYDNPKGKTIDIRPNGSSGVSVIGGAGKDNIFYYLGYQTGRNNTFLNETFNINTGSGSTKRRIYHIDLNIGLFIKDIIDKTSKN